MAIMDLEDSVISAAAGVVIHVLLALLFLFASVANVLVLVIFYRKPALRSLSNRFVMSLLLFNLVATFVLLPLILIDSLIDVTTTDDFNNYDYAVCAAGQAVTTLVTTGSISAALVIAVDQYCAVMAPLHYHRRVTKIKAWLLLAGQWILAAALSAFSLPDSAGKRFWKGCAAAGTTSVSSPSTNVSSITDDDESMSNRTTTAAAAAATEEFIAQQPTQDIWTLLFVSSSIVCYIVPLALLTWMYLRIYSAAHRNSQRTRRTSLTHSASELVVHCLGNHHGHSHGHAAQQQSPPSSISGSLVQVSQASSGQESCDRLPSRTPSLRSTSSQIVHNLRYRISNASLFLYREEARAARVSVLVLVLVVCCWMPYHVLLALSAWYPVVPAYAYHLGLVAVLLNALASPFLYAYRSRRIQREVRRLFGLPPKSKKRQGKAVGLHRELANSSSGQYGHKRRCGPGGPGQKSLRSLSPRRQLLRKQVRQGACVSEAAVSSTFEEVSTTTTTSTDQARIGRFFARMTSRLMWRSKSPGVAVHQPANTCPLLPSAVPAAAAVTGELLRQQAAVTRSSFSSATSSNSSCSAESDVSL